MIPVDLTGRPGRPRRPCAQDREAVAALRHQARRVERLARRVRGEWREKLLTIRMEALLGRRVAAMLENTVIALIPVLIGLIAGEWLLERPGRSRPRSISSSPGPTWRSARCCSWRSRSGWPWRRARLVPAPAPADRPGALAAFWVRAHEIDLAEMAMPAAAAAGTGMLECLAQPAAWPRCCGRPG